jgi:VWFA-related protein
MNEAIQFDRIDFADSSSRRPLHGPGPANCVVLSLLISVLFSCAVPVLGQNMDDPIRVDTQLAAFEVTVTDRSGIPVRNLAADEFRIFENGIERRIDFFQPIKKNAGDRPLSIVFALDVSGSMTEEELGKLKAAMRNFIDRLAGYNSYFAVTTFSMNVKTIQPFTNRPDRLERSFEKIVRDRSGLSTHAFDAVDDAIRLIVRKAPRSVAGKLPKRAVIVITDGFPVGDIVSPKTVIERANSAETTVYSVILPSFSRLQGSKRPLFTPFEASGLIDRTGGKSLYANERSFEPLFTALAEEITASYALAFYPGDIGNSDSDYRIVRIESRSGYVLKQNRDGYRPFK